MKTLLSTICVCVLCTLGAVTGSAQTRLIAHKSHSGSEEYFGYVLQTRGFDLAHTSFGRAPERWVQNAQLDSVIKLSDTAAVMVTSLYCTDLSEDTTIRWRAGRDTVYHHPLFAKKRNLTDIKAQLQREYYFKNPVDSIRFIGFDRGQPQRGQRPQNQLTPPLGGVQPPPNTPGMLMYLLGFSVLLSLGVGWVYQEIQKNRSFDHK